MSLSTVSPSHKRLEGKVAIITGGASGIGASSVQLFHENGAKVVIADIQDDKGQALVNKLGENVSYVHCDVSNEEQVSDLVDTTVAKHGKLDIMYNNAGILDSGVLTSIVNIDTVEFQKLVQINLMGSFFGAKHAARVMIPNKSGCILFTASASTEIAGLASAAYTATKYGILGLSKTLTAELGMFGIRVNCISPYGVATGMTSGDDVYKVAEVEAQLSHMGNLKGRVLKPEGVAQAAVYLASEEASYVSGVNLVVDGGYSAVNPTLPNALSQIH